MKPGARWGAHALTLLFLGACVSGGIAGPPAPDPEAIGFEERASSFYRSLESVPLDALLTFEDPKLQSYFAGQPDFADYYSALANAVRAASFRDGRVLSVDILEFRFDQPDLAHVEVRIAGNHQRRLRFWEIELQRTDTWRRKEGVWVLSPDKL